MRARKSKTRIRVQDDIQVLGRRRVVLLLSRQGTKEGPEHGVDDMSGTRIDGMSLMDVERK